jgi:hypothetical protein
MSNKKENSESNIQKLIGSSLRIENLPDPNHKEVVMNMLLQKLAQQKKVFQPKPASVIGIFVLWIFTVLLVFIGLKDSTYIFDLVKTALGLSMLLIPVSSIILIILKLWSHEKRIV